MERVWTDDAGEIQEVLSLLDSYPDNRRFGWRLLGLPGGGYTEPYQMMWVNLYAPLDNGGGDVLQYIAADDGCLQVFGSGRFGDVPAGVGRFGNEGTKRYFTALYQLYEQKEKSPLWSKETIRGADDPPDAAS